MVFLFNFASKTGTDFKKLFNQQWQCRNYVCVFILVKIGALSCVWRLTGETNMEKRILQKSKVGQTRYVPLAYQVTLTPFGKYCTTIFQWQLCKNYSYVSAKAFWLKPLLIWIYLTLKRMRGGKIAPPTVFHLFKPNFVIRILPDNISKFKHIHYGHFGTL